MKKLQSTILKAVSILVLLCIPITAQIHTGISMAVDISNWQPNYTKFDDVTVQILKSGKLVWSETVKNVEIINSVFYITVGMQNPISPDFLDAETSHFNFIIQGQDVLYNQITTIPQSILAIKAYEAATANFALKAKSSDSATIANSVDWKNIKNIPNIGSLSGTLNISTQVANNAISPEKLQNIPGNKIIGIENINMKKSIEETLDGKLQMKVINKSPNNKTGSEVRVIGDNGAIDGVLGSEKNNQGQGLIYIGSMTDNDVVIKRNNQDMMTLKKDSVHISKPIVVDGSQITNLSGAHITGTIPNASIPKGSISNDHITTVDGSKITGTIKATVEKNSITNDHITGIDATKISGTLKTTVLPKNSITNAHISGTIDGSKISGTINAAIPNGTITNAHVKSDAKIDFSKLNITKAHIKSLGFLDTDTKLSQAEVDQFAINEGFVKSAYSDLITEGYLDNNNNTDLMTQAQISALIANYDTNNELIHQNHSKDVPQGNLDLILKNQSINNQTGTKLSLLGSNGNIQGSVISEKNDAGVGIVSFGSESNHDVTLKRNNSDLVTLKANSVNFAKPIVADGSQLTNISASNIVGTIPNAAIGNSAITNAHIHPSTKIDFSKLNITKQNMADIGIAVEDTTLSQAQVGSFATKEGFVKSAYSDLTTEGYLDNNSNTDLMTKSQITTLLNQAQSNIPLSKLNSDKRAAWSSNYDTLHFSNTFAMGTNTNTGLSSIFLNTYYDSSGSLKHMTGQNLHGGVIDFNPTSGVIDFKMTSIHNDQGDLVEGLDSVLHINRHGNIGIGNNSPAVRLDIHTPSATGTEEVIRVSNANGTETGGVVRDGSSLGVRAAANLVLEGDYDANSGSSDSNVIFNTKGSEKVRIDANGNVGIGTSTPHEKFVVNAGTSNGGALIHAAAPRLYLETNSASHYNWKISAQDTINGGIEFSVGNADSNSVDDTYTQAMVINKDKNVGIGSNHPVNKLDVNGVLRTQGHYLNVVSYAGGSISKGIKIKTNIPYSNASQMPTIMIEGFNYGARRSIGLMINWYIYNHKWHYYTASSHGGTLPTIKLGEESGKVVIFLQGSFYVPQFSVRAFAQSRGENPSWFEGWSVVDEDLYSTNTVTVPINNSFGQVGIGTGSPLDTLDVRGNARFGANQSVRIADPFSSNDAAIELYRDNGTQLSVRLHGEGNSFINGGNLGIGTTNPKASLEINTRGAALDGVRLNNGSREIAFGISSSGLFQLHDYTAAATRMVIDANGNVGVGTASPTQKLHVYEAKNFDYSALIKNGGGSGYGLLIEAGSSGANVPLLTLQGTDGEKRFEFKGNGSSFLNGSSLIQGSITTKGTGGNGAHIAFKSTLANGTQHEFYGDSPSAGDLTLYDRRINQRVMTWKNNGNVGIGTYQPATRLEVQSPSATGTEEVIRISNSSGTETGGIARSGSNLNLRSAANIVIGADHNADSSSADSNVIFNTKGAEKVRIDANGNVGIGTASPTQKLDVAGTIKGTSLEVINGGSIKAARIDKLIVGEIVVDPKLIIDNQKVIISSVPESNVYPAPVNENNAVTPVQEFFIQKSANLWSSTSYSFDLGIDTRYYQPVSVEVTIIRNDGYAFPHDYYDSGGNYHDPTNWNLPTNARYYMYPSGNKVFLNLEIRDDGFFRDPNFNNAKIGIIVKTRKVG